MDRELVATALEEIALLLELLGENPFKIRAYTNGARAVRDLDGDLDEIVDGGGLVEIKGIGKALADKIATLVTTGELPYLERLRSEVPAGLVDWLKVPGLGPKKARKIHVALGIETLDELAAACGAGRVAGLEGFGRTSEAKILAGIELVRRHAGRYRRPVVLEAAEALAALVSGVEGVARVEICGSLRRGSPTSKDVDIVAAVASDEAAKSLAEAFARGPLVEEVTARGSTKVSVRLSSGPGADLRMVSPEAFPFAVQYFTGSKAHNVALRSRARELGLTLNEYALTREADGEQLACRDEAEVYRALGLAWIPPELREDAGELEAAESDAIPRLLERSDLRGALHCHSTWSDGRASIAEMAKAAAELGFSYLSICDHSQSAGYAGGLDADQLRDQRAEIDALNATFADGFRILQGIEVDILTDGSLDFPAEVLASLDLVVAAVHSGFGLSRDDQTARIVRALRSGSVDVLAHPTGRLLLEREAYAVDLHAVIDEAVERRVAIEVNAHPSRLDLDWRGLRYGLPRGLTTVISTDAHDAGGLEDVPFGVSMARKGWATAGDVLNTLPAEGFLERLARRRERR